MEFDPISLEILWNRLVAITDEAAATLIRTSFSTIVRESLDFACVLLDGQGRSLAQCTVAPPSFIGTLPRTVKGLTEYAVWVHVEHRISRDKHIKRVE